MAGIKIPGATSVEVIGHHMSLSAITSERISWRGRLIFLSVITCTNALPVTFLPHCGTCKLFIGHGTDARDLHDQKELHKFRASRLGARNSETEVQGESSRRHGSAARKRWASPPKETVAIGGGASDAHFCDSGFDWAVKTAGLLAQGPRQIDWLNRDHDLPWHVNPAIGEVYLLAIELYRPERAITTTQETLRYRGRNTHLYCRVRVVSLYDEADDLVRRAISDMAVFVPPHAYFTLLSTRSCMILTRTIGMYLQGVARGPRAPSSRSLLASA